MPTKTFGTMYECGALRPGGIVDKARIDGLGAYDFDTMVGTGLSGSLVIPMLAEAFGKEWAIVRKVDERAHSSARIEGTIGERWVFVDDLVSSGATFKRVVQAVAQECASHVHHTTFAGAYTYQKYGGWSTVEECSKWMGYTPAWAEPEPIRVPDPIDAQALAYRDLAFGDASSALMAKYNPAF